MGKFLIDTYVFLWSLQDPAKLSKCALNVIENQNNTIYVSAAVSWEIVIKRTKGTLHFEGDMKKHLYEQSFIYEREPKSSLSWGYV